MNGVGAWQRCECRMPPAQCRVTWFLKSSPEAQVVLLPLVTLKSPVLLQVDLTLHLRNVCGGFLGIQGGGSRE